MMKPARQPSDAGTSSRPKTALVLPGGGARGAYQAGVLKAIAEFDPRGKNPFPVICGVSAGAINAAVVASHAHEFATGIQRLEHFWSTMHCARVYRTDALCVLANALRWAVSIPLGGRWVAHPHSLLDNRPLQRFLDKTLHLEGIEQAIECGELCGVAVTASGYTVASAISFFQANETIESWSRERRHGIRARLTTAHLLASAALPLIFPAVQIGNEYFGDGGMRMITPLSPAIHLGAERLLLVTTRDEHPDPPPATALPYPSLGEIGGYLLDTVFMDTINADLNRLKRINRTLSLIAPENRAAAGLKPIAALVIRPSEDLRTVTQQHIGDIPPAVRFLLRSLGGWGRDWRLASYLLFEAAYCQELIALGYKDGMAMRDEIQSFLAGD